MIRLILEIVIGALIILVLTPTALANFGYVGLIILSCMGGIIGFYIGWRGTDR